MQERSMSSRDISSKLSSDIACLKVLNEPIRQTREGLSSHLYAVFLSFIKHFSQKSHINILSLACGVPDEFLALKVLLQEKNISMNYVGIDVDVDNINDCKRIFEKFENNLTLLTGDITHPFQLERMMEYNGCLPKHGFDLIILRQPNIIELPKIFEPALLTTIPYFASCDARVFISTYHMQEVQAVGKIALESTDRYAAPGKGNFCDLSGHRIIISGQVYFPDHFSVILTCAGNGIALRQGNMQSTGSGKVFKEILHQRFFGGLKMNAREIDDEIAKEVEALSAVKP
jgi:hypothetical protein